jgi:hypothetical protein
MEKRAILIPNSEHPIEMTPNLARVTIHANVQIAPIGNEVGLSEVSSDPTNRLILAKRHSR